MPSVFHRSIGRTRRETARDRYERLARQVAGARAVNDRELAFQRLTPENVAEALDYQDQRQERHYQKLMADWPEAQTKSGQGTTR